MATEEKQEAAKLAISVDGAGDDWSVEEEAAVVKKLDKYIMPAVCLLYLANYLDRGNIGNAKVANTDVEHAGMLYDLNMTSLDYNFALGIFFLGYCLGEIPCNFFLKAWGARRWFARILITWGIFAMCLGAVQNFVGLMVVRFLFGVAEAGFFPGMTFYFILFYRPYERARRVSWLYTMSPGASAFSGLLATAISYMNGLAGVAGWRWIFIIEGAPSIILGVATLFYLPDYPSTCWFLNEREKYIAINRLPKDDVKQSHKTFVLSEYLQMFKDMRVWCFTFMYLIWNNSSYANSAYLPTVIKAMGYTSTTAQLLTVPIYLSGLIAIPFLGEFADRTKKNWMAMSISIITSLTGFIINATATNSAQARYFGLFLNVIGIVTQLGPLMAWIAQLFHGEGATKVAGAIGFISGLGHLGGIVGPQIFQDDDKPKYTRAWTILAVSYAVHLSFVWLIQYIYGYSKAAKEDEQYHSVHDKIHDGQHQHKTQEAQEV
ncbi:MFS general substrate transporter [Gonapodya prolifera JEL478]|uniref:MFS general substrate transporter n=1 Tax=Gonapodya prolifera (strain JEL478) TaxID=1344416 RepID=A0A139AII8_GONPJ|nr:MFS general substrate transporter [Gonapodya prolifera JEL478]|eukprot:KXS16631.1 MFS general substrate transporter [Gonapodya prolifera JEL478]